MNQDWLKMLYRSFDDELCASERDQLDRALAESSELRAEKSRLEKIRMALADQQPRFDPHFDVRVIRRIREELGGSAFNGLLASLSIMFRRVALTGGLAVLLAAVVNMALSHEISINAALAVDNQPAEQILTTPLESILE